MLQDIRKSTQGTTAKIIIGLIVLAFALWGVESILLGGGSNAVAEVNGEDIGPVELQQSMNVERRRLINTMGENIDPAALEDQAITQRAMQSLIRRKLLLQTADAMGLFISNAQIGSVIGKMEQFQLDGKFSEELYRATLGEAGYSPQSFKVAMHDDMIVGQLRTGLAASDFTTDAELQLNAAVVAEQRDMRYLIIPLDSFRGQGEVSEQDVEAYYAQHEEDFRSPESVDIDYIELRAEDFSQPVSEDALQQAYRQEVQGRQYQPESRVSHILLIRGSGESDEAYAARIAQVQEKLDAGEEFADLARSLSDDPGSAPAGGDLGYSSGDVFPEPMEEAIKDLAVGQVSAPVTTDAGTHFIEVTERRDAQPPSFEELRPGLEQRLALEEGRSELLRTVETLKDLAFNAEGLEGPAAELGLVVSHAAGVGRGQEEGLFANASLNEAAFSEEVLDGGMNSDVMELNPDLWVVLRVRTHHQPELLPLADVRATISAEIAEQQAHAAAEQAAQAAVEALRAGTGVETYARESGYEWQVELGADRRNTTLPRELLVDAFRLQAPAEGTSGVDYVAAASGDYYVYALTRVTPGTLDRLPEPDRKSLRQLLTAESGQLADSEFRQGLLESAEIKVM